MFVDKTFKHKFISKNNMIAFVILILYIYIVFIASRYDDREFKKILIDHDVADFSFEDIEQFTILQRINNTTLSLNKNKIIFFKFDIDETFFIDTINLNTSIDVITFHIVFVHISFLLCLINMNRLRLYFNNLINMFIEKQSNIKVLFEKKLYFIHSNQIKRFQIQILMNSKSLIRNDEIIFDFQIDMKLF
jgi:NADPH-dependent 7-cyano-7-deazaguanine reductase QueF-like protein